MLSYTDLFFFQTRVTLPLVDRIDHGSYTLAQPPKTDYSYFHLRPVLLGRIIINQLVQNMSYTWILGEKGGGGDPMLEVFKREGRGQKECSSIASCLNRSCSCHYFPHIFFNSTVYTRKSPLLWEWGLIIHPCSTNDTIHSAGLPNLDECCCFNICLLSRLPFENLLKHERHPFPMPCRTLPQPKNKTLKNK